MHLRSEDGRSTFSLDQCGVELMTYPSLCFSVEIRTPNVSGGLGEIWFELKACERFMEGLATLDQHRRGNIRLESLSPSEFHFEIFAINQRGHLGIRLHLQGTRHSESTSFPFSLTAGFQIDPTSLPHLIAALRADVEQQKLGAV